MCAVTETWLSIAKGEKENIVRNEVTPHGYQLIHVPYRKGHGDGVGLLIKSSLKVQKQTFTGVQSFEDTEVLLSGPRYVIHLCVLPTSTWRQAQPTHFCFPS